MSIGPCVLFIMSTVNENIILHTHTHTILYKWLSMVGRVNAYTSVYIYNTQHTLYSIRCTMHNLLYTSIYYMRIYMPYIIKCQKIVNTNNHTIWIILFRDVNTYIMSLYVQYIVHT